MGYSKLKEHKKSIFITIFLIFFIIGWIILLFFVSPEKIVEFIGVENAYLSVFIIGVLGGVSSITGGILYTIMATFIFGGANLWIMGFVAGIAISFGDVLYFYVASRGKDLLPEKSNKLAERLAIWLEKQNKYFVPVFFFLYAGFAPLPNDILTITIGITGYPIKKIVLPLVLGDIIHMLLVSFLISQGINFF